MSMTDREWTSIMITRTGRGECYAQGSKDEKKVEDEGLKSDEGYSHEEVEAKMTGAASTSPTGSSTCKYMCEVI
jgi:hypothetical protein